jgi:hypothetical protein
MAKAKNSDTNTVKSIQPVVLRTDNVAKELVRIASSYKVPVKTLDFKLLSIQTFTKSGAQDSEEWMELSSDELNELDNDSQLLIPDFQIKQTYEIEIYTKVEDESKLNRLDVSIGANKTVTKVYLTIKPGSVLEYYDNFSQDFVRVINKKKLRANIMVGIFDSHTLDVVNTLRARLRVNDEIVFEKKEVMLVAEGIEPVMTRDDELIMHYEHKRESEKESDRIDYSKRGYLLSVVKDELLIEYRKAKLGEPGRNCRGEFIEPKEPVTSNEPTFSVSENIEVIETEDSILYRSKVNGYVTFENATYDIKTEVDVSEISFKTTGSIETELDADVSINVTEKDVLKDAVGMGMEVEVNEIHVEGNVGPNAKVRSMKAVIEGQTHKSSYVESDVLDINIHKGVAKGREVHITRLEHGEIMADTVTISQALGGKIFAREITIETLGSHVKLHASHKITINKLQGGENIFVIDPLVSMDCQAKVEDSKKLLKEAKESIKALTLEVNKHSAIVKRNEPAFKDIKRKLVHYKKSGVKMPSSFVKKFKEFQSFSEHLENLKKELREKEENYELLQIKYHSAQNEIFESRVINNDRWRNHNEIIFRLIDPVMEVHLVPEHNSVMKILGLKERDEDYFIVEMSE